MKTLNKIILGTFTAVSMLLFVSCKKWLDLKPLDGIILQEFWKSKEDLNAAVVSCYSSMLTTPPGFAKDRAVTETLFLWGELRGDMLQTTITTEQAARDIMNLNIVSTNAILDWSAIYRTINFCNLVLRYAPDVKRNDPTLSDVTYNARLGEALAIRSMMYFYLTRTFGDVPFKRFATSKDEDIADIGKAPQAQILDSLVKDLQLAEELLPVSHEDMQRTKGRITKLAAQAMLADVYLWMDRYADCLQQCEKINAYSTANPDKLSLVTSNWWAEVFGGGFSKETIFAFANSSFGAPPNALRSIFQGGSGSNVRFTAALKYNEEVFPLSEIEDSIDVRQPFSATSSGSIVKYGTDNPSYVNFQVYRYSDVLLMQAEALAMTDRGAEALDIIHRLRTVRHAVVESAQNIDPTDKDGIVDYILAERARELAFEGKRWFDYLRIAKRENYRRINLLVELIGSTVAIDNRESAQTKILDYNSHYLPISQTEIFADTTLKQNPFYAK